MPYYQDETRPRRRAADAQMERLFTDMDRMFKELAALQEGQVEARAARLRTFKSIDCLKDSFEAYKVEDEAWKGRFEPYLVEQLTAVEERRKFIREQLHTWQARVFNLAVTGVIIVFIYGLLAGDWIKKIYAKVATSL